MRDQIVIRLLLAFRQLIGIRKQIVDSNYISTSWSSSNLTCTNNSGLNSNLTSNSNLKPKKNSRKRLDPGNEGHI